MSNIYGNQILGSAPPAEAPQRELDSLNSRLEMLAKAFAVTGNELHMIATDLLGSSPVAVSANDKEIPKNSRFSVSRDLLQQLDRALSAINEAKERLGRV